MILETQVRFQRAERDKILAAAAHMGIVYPDSNTRETRPPEWRAINAAAEGNPLSHAALQLMLTAFKLLQEACAEQAQVSYWEGLLLRPAGVGITAEVQAGGPPLILDPQQMCRVMAEAREMQFVHATAAVNLVREALRHVPPSPPSEKWEGL